MKNKTHYELKSSQATWGPFETKESARLRLSELNEARNTLLHPAGSLFEPHLFEVDSETGKVVGRESNGVWFELNK